jgi:Ca-activated chloride channel homolog
MSLVSRRKQVWYALLSILTLTLMLCLPHAQQAQEHQGATLNTKSNASDPSGLLRADGTVMLTVTVTDGKGQYFDGLSRNAFSIMADRLPQEIKFFSNDDMPSSIGVLFDDSGSMDRLGKERLAAIKDSLTTFFQQGHNANQYFMMSFSNSPQLLTDWTSDAKALNSGVAKLPPSGKMLTGKTVFYDASLVGLEKLAGGAHNKHALIVISDGLDTNSKHSFKELREQLKRSNMLLYTVTITNRNNGSDPLPESHEILNELTEVTGGMALYPWTVAEIRIAFEIIALELRHQYSVGFKPTAPDAADKWHSVKVKVAPFNAGKKEVKLSARSRDGYYAP